MRAALAAVAVALLAGAGPSPRLSGCPVFPASNSWNQRVDRLPVARDSATVIRSIGLDESLHADFGSGLWEGGPIGIPITVVSVEQPKVRVSFQYADESDRGPYPIPRGVAIEGGRASDGDRHAILVDRDRCSSTSSMRCTRWRAVAGRPARARSGIYARTGCGRQGGRRRMPPVCRSCRGSRGTTR